MTYCTVTPMRIGAVAVPGFMAAATRKRRVELGVWTFLVESGDTRILFDGGLVGDMEVTRSHVSTTLGTGFGYVGAEQAAVRASLAALKLAPEDIDLAVVSHLHHDHAGALEWLPRAKVWVHAAELEDLVSPQAKNLAPDWQITPGTRRRLDELRSNGRLVVWDSESVALSGAVELARVGGHTRGSVALLGRVRSDWRIALLGDLLLTEAHIRIGQVPSTALDAYATVRSTSLLLAKVDELWPGHAVEGSVLSVAAFSSWPTAKEWIDDD